MAKISNKNIKEDGNPFGKSENSSSGKSGKPLSELGGKSGNINDLGLNTGSLPTPADAPETPSVEDGSRDSARANIGSLKGSVKGSSNRSKEFSKERPKEPSEDDIDESSMTFAEMLEAMQCTNKSKCITKEDDNMEDDFGGGFEAGGVDGADGAITGDDNGGETSGQGISVTKEFLLKLVSATMGKTFDETQLNLIVDTISDASTGATLDVSDIPEIMEKLKAAAGDENPDTADSADAFGGDTGEDDIDSIDTPSAGEEGEEGAGEFSKKTKLIDSEDKENLEEGVLGVFGIKPVIRNSNDWNSQETNEDDDEETAMIRAMKKRAGLRYWK